MTDVTGDTLTLEKTADVIDMAGSTLPSTGGMGTTIFYVLGAILVLGAGVVLLICALLDTKTIRSYIEICDRLGLSALVEVHDENEMDSAIKAGARVIGVNNRNLKDFTVDISNSTRLRSLAPENALFVAESGIKTAEDIQVLKDAGVNGVLIGETLMRSPDKAAMLAALNGGAL